MPKLPKGTHRLFSKNGYPKALLQQLAQDRDTVAALAQATFFAPGQTLEGFLDGDDSMGSLMVLTLACHHQLPGVHAALVELLHLDARRLDATVGDWLTEKTASHLVRSFSGDPAPLFGLLRDTQASVWARDQAVMALAALSFEDRVPREELAEASREVALHHLGTDEPEVLLETLIAAVSALQDALVPWSAEAMLGVENRDDPDLRGALRDAAIAEERRSHLAHLLATVSWSGPDLYEHWYCWTLWADKKQRRSPRRSRGD